MSYPSFYRQLNERAQKLFPGLQEIGAPAWEHLISPIELRLPKKIQRNVQAAIKAFYAASRRPAYRAQLESVPGLTEKVPANHSVLMAYDFHTNEEGEAFLVEVNTNASGFMLASLMEMTHQGLAIDAYQPLKDLASSFRNELKLGGKSDANPHIAITDQDILQQKMYPEFLMYRDWFRSMGWSAEFCEARDFTFGEGQLLDSQNRAVDLVYNRLTDFYLEDEEHAALRSGYRQDAALLSPNPYEYWLVGDKQRLIQLGDPDFISRAHISHDEAAAIQRVIIPTFDKTSFASADQIWADRRRLFFKPKRSHGGKSVYRGESVSKKVFERLMADDILIQRYQPAARVPVDDPRSVLENWKFDLRFFVYEDQIQMVCARIYQGQVTNFASPMGGFTKVIFV